MWTKDLVKSSHWRCSTKNAVLKNFAIFTGKHLCWSLFLTRLQACNFIIKRPLQHRCFPVNIAKFLGNFEKHHTYFEKHLQAAASVQYKIYLVLINSKEKIMQGCAGTLLVESL